MASRIDGATLHSWGEVLIDDSKAAKLERRKSQKSCGSTMHNKAAAIRFLIIDEISTAALKVLGILEKHTLTAKEGTPGAEDEDEKLGGTRPWGGANLIVGGDWLQLPAVCAKSIFRNPFMRDYITVERRILNM